MHRNQHAGTHKESPQQAQRESRQRQQHGPGTKAAALFGHRQRMQQRGADQPRHKRGVFHRVPEPPTAPAQFVIGPRRAQHDPKSQEHPRRLRPRARPSRPRGIQPPRQQRRNREGEGHREANVAHVEDRWMKNHPDILQHRIEIAAIYGIQRQAAAERIGGEQDKKQETEGDHSHHRQHPRYRVRRHLATEERDGERPHAEQQHPQQQRAFVRSPGGRHPVPHRQRAVGVFRHIAHGEIIDYKGMHQQRKRADDADKQRAGQRPG